MAYKKTEHLVKEELLDVLWAVDPHYFFFAYVDADARKLVAVQPPARVGAFRVPVTRSEAAQARVVAGDAWADELLPAGVKFQRLVLVLRTRARIGLLGRRRAYNSDLVRLWRRGIPSTVNKIQCTHTATHTVTSACSLACVLHHLHTTPAYKMPV